MGCDIHMVLEKRYNERWLGVNAFPYSKTSVYPHYFKSLSPEDERKMYEGVSPLRLAQQRNYSLFAELAGVRGAGPNPKGLPEPPDI